MNRLRLRNGAGECVSRCRRSDSSSEPNAGSSSGATLRVRGGCRDVVIRARGLDHRRNAVSEKRGKLDPGCSRDRIALRWGRELREKRIDVNQGEGRRATAGQGPERLLERLAGIESIRLST